MAEGLPNLGPVMSLSDPTYTSSAASLAGASSHGPKCECPGFDTQLVRTPEAMLGRWVRSPKKFVGWDVYMEFFGLHGDKALQETEEPQEHIILSFSKEKFRILHRLPWRDGLDCEYTVPIDGSKQPVPPAMVAKASSSWKVNDLASWVHAWDEGDGNPLHRGLRTEQKLRIKDTDYTLRYWRSLMGPREIRVNVEVTYADTGKYAVHTQRFFHKIDVDPVYAIACVPPAVSSIEAVSTWTHAGRGVRIAILPHASNMRDGWKDLAKAEQWDQAEPFPSAGRSSGPYLSKLRDVARDARLWVCCGVVLRSPHDDGPSLLRGVALIGADGWLHAVHTDAAPPPGSPYSSGSGDWPATQQTRPRGVYDTELGRIALSANIPDGELVVELASMGAEIVLVPPTDIDGSVPASRVAVSLHPSSIHSNLTRYELCGPEPLSHEVAPGDACRLVVVGQGEHGTLAAEEKVLPSLKRPCPA